MSSRPCPACDDRGYRTYPVEQFGGFETRVDCGVCSVCHECRGRRFRVDRPATRAARLDLAGAYVLTGCRTCAPSWRHVLLSRGRVIGRLNQAGVQP